MDSPFTTAKWITIPETEPVRIRTAYFRLIFPAKKSSRLTLSISAHSRYRLYVNGQSVTFGPCRGDHLRQFYETVDVSDALKDGANILTVKVVSYPPYEAQHDNEYGPMWSMNRAIGPALIVAGVCMDEDGNAFDIATGQAGWQTLEDTAIAWRRFQLTHWMGSMESVNGARLPHGWERGADLGGAWQSPRMLWPAHSKMLDMFGIVPVFSLMERPIPLLYERPGAFLREMPLKATDVSPILFGENDRVEIPANSHMAVELDAGLLYTAFLHYRFTGGAGSEVIFRYAESYSREAQPHLVKGRRDDWENFDINGHEDCYHPGGGEEAYMPFWFRTFRFLRIEVKTAGQPLIIHKPSFFETGYPLDVHSNVCASEDWVEKLWEMSVRTLERCMQETYVDCPYYEQLQYLQDSRLEMLFTYAVSGDTRMARRTIEDFHSSKMPDGMLQARYPSQEPHAIPAFAFQWIAMLLEYYWQTGNIDILTQYRSTIDGILDWFAVRIGPTGMVERLGYWAHVDWVDQWSELAGCAPASLVGPSAANNLMYAYALQLGAEINRMIGRTGMAAEYADRASDILGRVEATCWDENEGLYLEGPGYIEYSQHTQVYAVLTGLKSGAAARTLMDRAMEKEGIALCSFTWQFFLFRALEKCEYYGRTENQWALWKGLLDKNLTTIPETPDGVTSPRSDCHAWSALPLYEFTRNLLGVRPSAPGWQGILIQPRTLSLVSCGGDVTTPKGNVHVEWSREGGTFSIAINAPVGVPVTLILPDGWEEMIPNGGRIERAV